MMTVSVQQKSPSIEQIIRAHQRDVWRFLLALGCEPAEAEDISQEVFVGVFRGGFEYRGEAETAAYLRKAAKNRFISTVRRRKRAPVVRNLDDVDVEWEQFNDDCDGDRRLHLLRVCLEALGDRARRALELQHREGLSRQQIAPQLDMKEAGVKTLLERARATLRECVQRRMAGHDQ
jgi:RNA polymerase sigma-70 factor (ECF subfamily)